ncbi:hypothetical protein HDU85_006416 [Gaertneriomyces sp. JEL0708]|nr:hypothetical protein HDU85_006416 [Gaertneriomyces sp. JEL0708]
MEGHDLQGVLERQRVWLRGGDGRWGRWLPKVVKLISDKLVNENCDTVAAYVAEYEGLEKVPDELVEIMADFNTSLTPNLDLPPRTLVELLLYWITSLKTPLASSAFISQISTASIVELDKGILYTLNVLINPLRGSSDRALFEHLARFLTRARTNLKHPFIPQLLYTNKVKALVQKVGKAPISTPTTSNAPGGGSGNAVDAEAEISEMNVLANFLFNLARDYICNEYGKPVAVSPQAAVKTIPDEDEDLVVESLKRASDVSRRMISVSLTSLEPQPLPGTDELSRPQFDGTLGQMTEVP